MVDYQSTVKKVETMTYTWRMGREKVAFYKLKTSLQNETGSLIVTREKNDRNWIFVSTLFFRGQQHRLLFFLIEKI